MLRCSDILLAMTSARSFTSHLLYLISFLYPLRDFVYLLQYEDYRAGRYVKWLPKFFFRRHIEQRARLAPTPRAIAIAAVTVLLQVVFFAGVRLLVLGDDANLLVVGVVLLFTLTATPLFVLWAHALTLVPFDIMHARTWRSAAKKVASMGEMQVVLLVGSFGKTTARTYVQELLRHVYTVSTPPGNINTETGVARWIAASLPRTTQILLLEADAYAPGDIARMCEIARPHIAVITALGDQHMERLGDKKTLVSATAEAFGEAHDVATLVARSDVWDELRTNGLVYKDKTNINADYVPRDYAGVEQTLVNLSHTNRSAALLALAVAHALKVPYRFVESSLTKVHLPHRRQEVTQLHAGTAVYDGMDDSYNISLTTAAAALRAARGEATRLRKKLLVVVAGIPEAGDAGRDNIHLALQCLETADATVVIESMFTPYFRGAFAHEKNKMLVLPSVRNSALLELPKHFEPSEWFVLLFNELGDVYH